MLHKANKAPCFSHSNGRAALMLCCFLLCASPSAGNIARYFFYHEIYCATKSHSWIFQWHGDTDKIMGQKKRGKEIAKMSTWGKSQNVRGHNVTKQGFFLGHLKMKFFSHYPSVTHLHLIPVCLLIFNCWNILLAVSPANSTPSLSSSEQRGAMFSIYSKALITHSGNYKTSFLSAKVPVAVVYFLHVPLLEFYRGRNIPTQCQCSGCLFYFRTFAWVPYRNFSFNSQSPKSSTVGLFNVTQSGWGWWGATESCQRRPETWDGCLLLLLIAQHKR